jgi:hypothetical protein
MRGNRDTGIDAITEALMAMSTPSNYQDATGRSHTMPRNSTLLYPNKQPAGADPPQYRGFLKLTDGQTFWISAWGRLVNGQTVVELKLTLKN